MKATEHPGRERYAADTLWTYPNRRRVRPVIDLDLGHACQYGYRRWPARQSAARCTEPCDHVLCDYPIPPHRTAPLEMLPPAALPGWRDRLDTPEIRAARDARKAAQARGYGVMTDPVIDGARLRPTCGCPTPDDGMVPACWWTGDHQQAGRAEA